MTDNVQIVAERRRMHGVCEPGGAPERARLLMITLNQQIGDVTMDRYSLAKVDNEYVVLAEGRSILRLSSRRQATRLISALMERERDIAAGVCVPYQRWRKPPPQPKPQRGPQ